MQSLQKVLFVGLRGYHEFYPVFPASGGVLCDICNSPVQAHSLNPQASRSGFL